VQPPPPLHEPAFVSMIGRTHVFKQSHWKSNEMRHSVQGQQTHTNGSFTFPKYSLSGLKSPNNNPLSYSIKSPNNTQFDQEMIDIVDPLGSPRESSLQKQQQMHDELFEKLHGNKVFMRTDPAPLDINLTAKKRL